MSRRRTLSIPVVAEASEVQPPFTADGSVAGGVPPAGVLERLTRLACQVLQAPVAIISLLESGGLSLGACCGFDGLGYDPAFCKRTVRGDAALIVPDARLDPRFCNEAIVTGAPGVRFYAGFPLVSAAGERLGTLCVIDFQPRAGLEPNQLEAFEDLAAVTVDAFGLRRTAQCHRQPSPRWDE